MMTTIDLVKKRVHVLVDTLPESKLMTLLDFAQFLETREEESELFEAQMQSTAYQEWVGEENDIYDELFSCESTAR
jgi:hypothetical protein